MAVYDLLLRRENTGERNDDDDDDKSNCLQLSTCVSSPIFHAFELRDKELPPITSQRKTSAQ
jgi:hypothetical protein